MFVDDYIDLVLVIMFVYLDVMIELFCVVFFKGIFFVVDLLVFSLIILDFSVVGDEYYCVV